MPFEQEHCQQRCPYKNTANFDEIKIKCRGVRASVEEWTPYYENGQVVGELAKWVCGSIIGSDKNTPGIGLQDWADTPLTPTELKALYDQGMLADQLLSRDEQ